MSWIITPLVLEEDSFVEAEMVRNVKIYRAGTNITYLPKILKGLV